jgi:hypothetical protein
LFSPQKSPDLLHLILLFYDLPCVALCPVSLASCTSQVRPLRPEDSEWESEGILGLVDPLFWRLTTTTQQTVSPSSPSPCHGTVLAAVITIHLTPDLIHMLISCMCTLARTLSSHSTNHNYSNLVTRHHRFYKEPMMYRYGRPKTGAIC